MDPHAATRTRTKLLTVKQTPNIHARAWLMVLALAWAAFAPTPVAGSDEPPVLPEWARQADIPLDELEIRLVPLRLDELELIKADTMAEVRACSAELAEVMIARAQLSRGGDADEQQVEAVAERTIGLLIRKKALVSRADAIIDAIEAKGGDAASERAYITAVANLRPDLGATLTKGEAANVTPHEIALKRVDELVAIVRATPPAHERPAPWDVPLSEFELELQPLSTEQVLERLDAWRRLLQAEVSKRIQIDILLNDTDKLERSVEVRNEGARLVGVASDEVTLDELKVALAERAEAQQQIITRIVDRMRVAIELSKRRGEDAQQYIDYIASSTGRKLNFSDLSVLRVQLMQWLTSSSGGLLIARNALLFIGIVALFWLISRTAGLITRSAVRRIPKASSLLGPVVAGIVQKVLIVVGFVFAASAVGVDTGPLLAMIGAAGLVIGLALQGTLSNFASGILILLNRPFDVGDVVDAGGVFGKVSAMNLVSTTILTFDNQLMLVPNNQIWNAVITNVTGKRTRRVDLTFGIAYSANIARAVEVLEEMLAAHPKTLADPAPIVRVHELGDSSVNLIARPWVRTDDYWDVYWDLMRQVKERFDREGIGIPFPQRDLHVPGAIEVRLSGAAPAATGTPSHPASPQVHRPDSEVRESGPPADDGD
jgi:small conductance mechanosensitive channel